MNQLMILLEGDFCGNLLTALLHSLWQGLVIAALLIFHLRTRAAKNANARYTASVIALTAIAICGLFTWAILNYEPAPPRDTPTVTTSHEEITTNFVPTGSNEQNSSISTIPIASESTPADSVGFNWQLWTVCLWLVGVVVMLFRAVYVMVGGTKLQRQCTALEDEHILELVEQLRKSLGIARRIRVAVSEHILVPGVVGFIRPILLLPVSIVSGVPTDDLKAILAHELSHVRRYDYLVNFCQMVIEAILFFNPAIWWISRQIRIEREACCDNAGIAATGQRIRYAEVLAGWAQRLKESNVKFAAAAIGFSKPDESGSLLERIRRIVISEHRPRLKVSWYIAAITLLLSLVALAVLWQGTTMTVALAGKLSTGQSKTIHFPKVRSIGELYIRDRDFPKDTIFASVDWEWLGNAQGDITVPAGKAVRLDISKEAWQDGKPFAGLRAHDIQMLSFTKYKEADDSVLEDIQNLTDLQVLGLSGTQILGTGLKHLGKLKELKWLSLAVTHVGDEELAFLAGLNSLEYLNLNYAPVGNEGMIHVGKIKTLKALVLSGTSVDDDGLEHLKDLTSLQQLRFFNNYITDEGLKNLAGLTELEELILMRTQVSGAGLVHLSNLKKLKNLRLGNTKVGDEGLKHLKELESLEYLELPSVTHITDEGLAQLSELHSLKNLYIISDSITEKGLESLSKLKSLEELDTGGQNINDTCMAKLTKFPSLKTLWIQNCPVTDAGLAELKNMQSLTTLKIGNCPITGEGLAILKEYPNLVGLELLRLNLGKAGLSVIAELTSLVSLRIYYTKITDDDLASLSNLRNLKILYVDSKEISDAGMQHLAKLKSLENLLLYGSEITDAGLVYLRGNDSLTYLGLPNTKVTEEGMAKLKKKIPALRYQL